VPLKVRDIIKKIEADRWYMVAQKGSHRPFKSPSKSGPVTVPGHLSDDLHPRLEKSILRQAKLD